MKINLGVCNLALSILLFILIILSGLQQIRHNKTMQTLIEQHQDALRGADQAEIRLKQQNGGTEV